MSERRIGLWFGLGTLLAYLVLTVPTLHSLALASPSPLWMLFGILHEGIALGVAVELAELVLAQWLPERHHPRLAVVPAAPRVAALYVCRDDVDQQALQAFKGLTDVDRFILDDSETPICRSLIDAAGVQVVRRSCRRDFKAGNLNNWLAGHGADYEYFVILDADSFVSAEAIGAMVAHAEHPANRDVAIVQSTIHHRPHNLFQLLLSVFEPLRLQITHRLHDRIGWTLSYGHNNLHRTSAIRQIGGFAPIASCEDTIASLLLHQAGWRIILVDTITYDAEPPNVFVYRRRMVRWARQSLEAVLRFPGNVGVARTMLMLRHLFAYLLPSACIAMLCLICLFSRSSLSDGWRAFRGNFVPTGSNGWAVASTYLISGAFLLLCAIRLAWAARNRVRLGLVLSSSLAGGAFIAFCAPYVLAGMLRSSLGQRVVFRPTGSSDQGEVTVLRLIVHMFAAWASYLAILTLLLRNPGTLLFGLNFVWVSLLVSAPFVLRLCHVRGGRHVA
jgi:cellulose synthase/poly-beta-1,6-N-acetylglucosamine synthase-like glycosyltransferase